MQKGLFITATTTNKASKPFSFERNLSANRSKALNLTSNNLIPKLKLDRISKASPSKVSKKIKQIFNDFKVTKRPKMCTQRSVKTSIVSQNISYENPQQAFEALDLPVLSEIIVQKFSRYLSEEEKKEILDLGKVYFLALNIPKSLKSSGPDSSFDDNIGNYILFQGDSLGFRFEILEILGRGSFSQVCKCLDHKKNEIVAVKIIKNKRKFNAQAEVEIRLLENIKNKDLDESSNTAHLKESFSFRGHTCLVFDLLSLNLYEFLKENNFKGLSTPLIRKVAVQILHALRFLKSIHIIHCDLKLENILLRSPDNSSIKIIDFGSGCYEHERIFSYVQSRFYRAPEVVLGVPYTTAIDMWSLGCILAELYTTVPLFPAENEVDLMSMFLELNDVPPVELLSKASKRKIFFDRENRPRLFTRPNGKVTRPKTKKLEEFIKTNDSKFLDFIQSNFYLGCLEWDPKKRMSPEEALRHDWITESQQKNIKKLKILRDIY